MQRRKFKIVLFVIPMLLLFTTIGVSASTWSSSIKVTNLSTWGGVKDLNVSHKKTNYYSSCVILYNPSICNTSNICSY